MYVEQNSKGIIGVNRLSILPQGHLVPFPEAITITSLLCPSRDGLFLHKYVDTYNL